MKKEQASQIRICPDWNVKDEEGMSYADRAELEYVQIGM